MMGLTASFTWERPSSGGAYFWRHVADDGGYTWAAEGEETRPTPRARRVGPSSRHEEDFFLTRRQDVPFQTYTPLVDEPALFRIFADTPQTPEGVLSFAARFGDYGPAFGQARRLSQWVEEVKRMSALVGLWDLLQADDVKGLKGSIRWDGDRVYWIIPEGLPVLELPSTMLGGAHAAIVGERGESQGQLGQFRPGAVTGPARKVLHSFVTAKLQEMATWLGWSSSGGSALFMKPPTLLSAMYLQFALAIDGNKVYRRCLGCGKWYELHTEGHRADRVTCSTSCRVKVHRQRQAAQQMRDEGKTPRVAAKALGLDVALVEEWFQRAKGKRS